MKPSTSMTVLALALIFSSGASLLQAAAPQRPNMLVISVDDVSWFEHSVYGLTDLPTPNVDRIFKNGIRFQNAFTSAPSCAPSRAAMLCGRQFWQNEQGAFMQAYFPKKFPTYPQILKKAGYETGFAGKGWGPGMAKIKEGQSYDKVAGTHYAKKRFAHDPKTTCLYPYDYTANFKDFLKKRDKKKSFCFWAGIFEPHGKWAKDNYKRLEKDYGIRWQNIKVAYMSTSTSPQFVDVSL